MNKRLPVPQKRVRIKSDNKGNESEEEYYVTDYAIHTKLRIAQEYLEKNPNGRVLLMLDELNRCEKPVMSELMNLILNREINGFELDSRIFIMAAMNPCSTSEGYEGNNDYAVTEMDAASKNRIIWLTLASDARDWIEWATDDNDAIKETAKKDIKIFDPKEYDTNIDQEVVEFIISHIDMLSKKDVGSDAYATPRSWSFVSDIYRTYKNNRSIFDEEHFATAINGAVGTINATAFRQFLANNTSPLITPEQLWGPVEKNTKELTKEWADKLKRETALRKSVTIKNVIRYLNEKNASTEKNMKITENDIKKFVDLVSEKYIAIDTKYMMYRKIKYDYPDLYATMGNHNAFVKAYMDSVKEVNG